MLNANRICQMGSPNNPTNMWFWNAADKTQGPGGSVQNLLGGGIGTITHTEGDDNIQVVSSYAGKERVAGSNEPADGRDRCGRSVLSSLHRSYHRSGLRPV